MNFMRGAGLLELLLSLCIAAVMILMSIRYYENYKKTQEIYLLETSVSYLMDALNSYYFMTCRENTTVTNQDIKWLLLKSGLLNKSVYNPWGGADNMTAEIIQDSQNFYALQVSVNIFIRNKPLYQTSLAGLIRGVLNADPLNLDSKVPNKITWTRLPSQSRDSLNSQEWIFNHKPVSLTAVNNGVTSTFWVLNNSLQKFTEAYNEKTACVN